MDETCFGLSDAMSADTVATAWENRALELCEEYLGPEKFVRRLAKHERVSWPLSRSSICRGVTRQLTSIDVNCVVVVSVTTKTLRFAVNVD